MRQAEIGDELLEPESGWKRYDDSCGLILYGGDFWTTENVDYNYTEYGKGYNSKFEFRLKGTRFRLISPVWSTHSSDLEIFVDGISQGKYSQSNDDYTVNETISVVTFEKTGLDDTIHLITVVNNNSTGTNDYLGIQYIDINDDGELIHPYTPTNLKAVAGDEEVGLSWDEVEDADTYIIKRSETEGGPYTVIEEDITGTSYTDRNVDNGTTYYYVVSAVVGGEESPISEEEGPVTPEGSSSGSGDKAILKITMQNGKINEYDLSMDEIEDFIDWFEDQDDPYYIIEKEYNIGPFESRKDYIVADKILQFEVMEYED